MKGSHRPPKAGALDISQSHLYTHIYSGGTGTEDLGLSLKQGEFSMVGSLKQERMAVIGEVTRHVFHNK